MKKSILSLFLVMLILSCFLSAEELGDYFPGRIVVCFSADAIRSNAGEIEVRRDAGTISTQFDWINELSTEFGITELRQMFQVKNRDWNRDGVYLMNLFTIQIPDHSRTEELRLALESRPEVIFAEFDPVLRMHNVPDDPLLNSQWAMKAIEAEKAWQFETGSEDVVIGIVDSGVKWNHPDLRANIWINPNIPAGITIDWDKGQYIGSDGTEIIMGWDFAVRQIGDWDLEESNNPFQAFPGNQHGTHVSGCAAAVGNNGIGVVGPAYTSKLMNTKHSFTNSQTNYIWNAYAGVIFCVENGAQIINGSWGGGSDSTYPNYVATFAKDHGALFIVSAGNSNRDNETVNNFPANARDSYSVVATEVSDRKAGFSSFGGNVGISAPGSGILSTYYGQNGENSYSNASGTSMASPIVAGVAALILSYYPDLTVDGIIERLEKGADPIDHLNEPRFAGKLGAGRVNAFNSLMYDRIPRVDVEFVETIDISGDDNTLNPGETITIKVHLKNRENFIDGLPTTAKIISNSPYANIIQDTVNYPDLPKGEVRSSTDNFVISIQENAPVETNIELTLLYYADGNTGVNFTYELPFDIVVSRNKDNWPIDTKFANVFSHIVFDFNQDGEKEIIYIDTNNWVHIVNSLKEPLDNFPVRITSYVTSQIAIIKSGNEYEILVTARDRLFKINTQGEISMSDPVTGVIVSNAVAYDIDNNGYDEIAIGTTRGMLYLFNNDLTTREGFPKALDSNLISMPLFVDFNKDGNVDLLVNSIDRHLHIFTAISGEQHAISPVFTNVNCIPGMVAIENNNDVFLLIAGTATNQESNIIILDNQGKIRASTRTTMAISLLPIVADLAGTGDLDIIVVTSSGILSVFDINLNLRPDFPIALSGNVSQHPIIADMTNNGKQDIIVPTNNGRLHAIQYDGTNVNNFPYIFNEAWCASPIFENIDGSNRINLLVSNMFGYYYLDIPVVYNKSEYNMFAYNVHRNAVYKTEFVNDYDNVLPEKTLSRLISNYPNPFNPETRIMFEIADINTNRAPKNASIDIFNIKGQKIQSLILSETNMKDGAVTWNAEGHASGIYMYRLMIDNVSVDVKRALLMK